ncbi:hypothetical protein ABZ896_49275, partial [Streptomyces sp. NPDC047072]
GLPVGAVRARRAASARSSRSGAAGLGSEAREALRGPIGAYRTLRDTYAAMGGQGVCPGTDLGDLDFTRAARFFGVDAVRADSADHLRELVAGAGALTGPLLVDVPVRE